MNRVLVPLDGTDLAARIIPDAIRLAGPNGTLILVRDANRPRYDPFTREYSEAVAVNEAQAYLDAVASTVHPPNIDVETHVTQYPNIAVAIDDAALVFDAGYVACATHGRGPVGRLVQGSVIWHMLTRSSVPVLVKHPAESEVKREEPERRTILVPLDGSARAELAVRLAVELAQQWDAAICLMHVVPGLPPVGPYRPVRTEISYWVADAKQYLQRVAADIPGETRLVVTTASVVGDIIDVVKSQGVTDVVMSTHGRTGMSRAVVGSVADALIHHLHVPIVLIPALAMAGLQRKWAAQPVEAPELTPA